MYIIVSSLLLQLLSPAPAPLPRVATTTTAAALLRPRRASAALLPRASFPSSTYTRFEFSALRLRDQAQGLIFSIEDTAGASLGANMLLDLLRSALLRQPLLRHHPRRQRQQGRRQEPQGSQRKWLARVQRIKEGSYKGLSDGDRGLSRRCQILSGFVSFVLLLTVICLIVWGAARPYVREKKNRASLLMTSMVVRVPQWGSNQDGHTELLSQHSCVQPFFSFWNTYMSLWAMFVCSI